MSTALAYLELFRDNGEWWTLCILATITVLFVYSLVYVIARSFFLDTILRTAKSEMIQAVATLFMILILVGIVTQIETFAISTLLGSSESYVICASEKWDLYEKDADTGKSVPSIKKTLDIVKCRLSERGRELADMYDDLRSGSETLFRNLSLYVAISGITIFSGAWVPSWFHEAESYRLLNSFITVVLIGLNSIIVLVTYISASALTVYLPVGLLLRSFKPVRGIGALFMSLAIGFYFIFPILFVLTDPGFVNIPALPGADEVTGDEFCFPTFSGAVSQIQETGGLGSISSSAGISDGARVVSQFYVFMTTHTFVIFSITLIFVRYIISILGGEAYDIMRFVAKMV